MTEHVPIVISGDAARRTFIRLQLVVVTTVLLLGVVAYIVPAVTGNNKVFGLIPLLDVGKESNLPTYVSTVNLLVAATLCFLLHTLDAVNGDRKAHGWLLLAAIFAYLSVDEAAMIHEKFDNIRAFVPEVSIIDPRHSWLFLGSAVALFLSLIMVPFLFRLPRRTASYFVLAGAMFAGGVIGMEFAGTLMLNHGIGPDDTIYQVRRLAEESLEMYGIVLFNCVAFGEVVERTGGTEIRVLDAGRPQPGNRI